MRPSLKTPGLALAALLAASTLLPRPAHADGGINVGSSGGWIAMLTILAVTPNVVPIVGSALCVRRHQRASGWGWAGVLLGGTAVAVGVPLFVGNGLGNGDVLSAVLGLGAAALGAANVALGGLCLSQPAPPPRAARWNLTPWGAETPRERVSGAMLTVSF